MHLKKLHLTSAFALAFALATLTTGCSEDDVVEIIGVCPIVVSTIPDDGDIDVALDQVISATFNEELNPETVNSQTFKVTVNGTAVAGTVSYSGMTAYFTPSANLLPFTIYTGTVTTGIKDPMGNALQENYVWSFTTMPQIMATASPETSGTVTGAGAFNNGSTVTVAATPNEGFVFTNWTVGEKIVSTSSSYQFTMDGNITLVANFAEVVAGNFRINLSSSPAAGGTTSGSGQFDEDSVVTVSALPNQGYFFENWTEDGTIVSTSSSYQFVLTENRTLIANYSTIPADQFAVILSASPAAGGSTNGSGSFDSGTNVTVTATPNTGYDFVNWTANGTEVSTNSSYTFELTANTTLVANFEVITYTLNVTAQNGTVSKDPNENTYNHGDQVVLTATPADGYEFSSWSGDASGDANPLTVTMNSDKNITANFTQIANAGEICPNPVVDLGAAGNYAILAKSGISTTGTTSITGNLGVSPITSTAITGFGLILSTDGTYSTSSLVTGRVYASDYTSPTPANLTTAVSNMETAFTTANGLAPDQTGYMAGNLDGQTLASGVYKWSTGLLVTNSITLDGGGVDCAKFVFQIAGDLTIANNTEIILINGAKADNIYWVVAGAGAMLGTDVDFSGNILSQTLISVNTRTSVKGRLLAQSAVTLNGNAIVKPSN